MIAPAQPFNPASPPSERNFLGNRFVYCVISERARGLSIGVNMNPDKRCNFDCVYCEVERKRGRKAAAGRVDVAEMSRELHETLALALSGGLRDLPAYRRTPPELLQLKEVALSGDGEPTLCPNFSEVVETVMHIRAQGDFPFFKIVLITNCTGLHLPDVRTGIRLLTARDAVWAKLDAGTQAYMERVNQTKIPFGQIVENIVALGRERSVVIQSLFPLIDEIEPSADEIDAYIARLCELAERGVNIELVQVYSAHRPTLRPNCGHLPLKILSAIARRVRDETGLPAEVF